MTLRQEHLPLALDRRRRRLSLALAVLVTGIAALVFAPPPWGGLGGGDTGQRLHSERALAQLTVPADATERQWRASVRSLERFPTSRSRAAALRRRVVAEARATDATLVRIRIWRSTSPAAVEVVLATDVDPAFYLRHRVARLVHLLQRPDYVKVVDGRGSSFFEWGGVANEGFLGVPFRLQRCSPVIAIGLQQPPPPCPSQ